MALKIYEKFAPFANPPTSEFPTGSIKDDSIPGAEDGTPVEADLLNDYRGADEALFAEVGITPNGDVDTALSSQRVDAIKLLHISNLSQSYDFESVVALQASTIDFKAKKRLSVKQDSSVPGQDGLAGLYEVVDSGALPDILLNNGRWARSLALKVQKGNASSYDDPILSAALYQGDDVNFWANFNSQNFMLCDGGSQLNNGASGSKDGSNNTGFGFGVFDVSTTSFACSGFGFQALGALTTGDSDTAYGYQALARCTTGKNNTAGGVDCGYNITEGSGNSLWGRHIFFEGSGTTDAIGDNNSILGYDVALNATTMADMSILGAQAHRDGVTSVSGVIIGSSCAQDGAPVTSSVLIGGLNNQNRPLTGSSTESVEIGFRVQQNNVGASNFNVLIGTRAFYSSGVEAVPTNDNNVGIGTEVGAKVSGATNVLIGSRAGAQATDVERNGMVCIGNRAGDGWANDNDLVIANNQLQTNPLINGNFSSRVLQLEATALTLRNLPTSAGATGTLWNNSGVLSVA